MRTIINPKNLTPDSTWLEFRKVRAIIENEEGYIPITIQAGKCIFPGGKCEKGEDEMLAITRELIEELGIEFKTEDFQKLLEIETFYDDFFDHRSNSIKPRHTITSYFYAKTKSAIDESKMELTEIELEKNFKAKFMDKKTLIEKLLEDHSQYENGKFFDEENRIIVDKVLNNL